MNFLKNALNVLTVIILLTPLSVSAGLVVIDADAYVSGTDIRDGFAGVTLSTVGVGVYEDLLDGRVYARTASAPTCATTGTNIFGNNLSGTSGGTPKNELWYRSSTPGGPAYRLRADFHDLTDYISIDFITNNTYDQGILEVYDSGDNLIYNTTVSVNSGNPITASITRPLADIAYIIASGTNSYTLCLDNLQADIVPEPATVSLLGLGAFVFLRKPRR